MADSSTAEEVNSPFERSGRQESPAPREWESRDGESNVMDYVGASSAAPQVVVEPSTPPSPATATAPPRPSPSPSPAPEADLPPSYDSLLVTNKRPSQRRSLSGPPPSYASTYRMERKISGPAGEPGGEAEASPARRMRKKPCVTLNIEEAFGASRDTWCSLASVRAPSPAPSLQQQEGEVNEFRSSGGKNVFFYVQDETEEASAARGCDNLGFVPDEEDGGQTEDFAAASDTKRTTSHAPEPASAPTLTKTPATPTPARRSSNPECLAVPREEMVRSQSFGTELDEAVAQPTLRKRSTSRGRPDTGPSDSLAESANRDTSLTPASSDRTQRQVAHLQTGSDGVSPSLLRKIFSSPFLGLSRTPSIKSCRSTRGSEEHGRHRSGGQYARPPQGPPSVREDHHRHYMVQHHLYRNSRRNVQEKLHRQLSECDCNHPHHLHGRHHHDSADHHHHHHHHGSSGRGHHHHRSQSTRSSARPRHEPLRRHNTYGHEHYLKIRQELEERQEADSLEASAGREEEEEQGEEEHSAVRRVSHYRQEEKGLTDVERWVGVHGGVGEDGAEPSSNAAASANTPTTPHIIVSAEEDEVADNTTPKVRLTYDNEDQCDSSASNGQVTNNGVAATGINGGPNNEEKRPKLSLTMNSLELPDARRLSFDYGYKKTRRGSINEILRRMEGSQINLQLPTHHHMRRSSSKNSLEPSVMDWRQEGNDSLIACVSALYGKLLVVMGMAFPVAEVISHNIPISFYNGFYLYLYIGSIVFLVYAYLFLLQTINIPTSQIKSKFQTLRRLHSKESRFSGNDADKESDRASINTMTFKPPKYGLTESSNHGSMYLKMGAVLFGIGSMIYSGLEVGQYFELQGGDSCADILLVISPAARMLFTFIQMYFIFLNSRVAISRHRIIARFGLMHMIGTNLCIWLNVLVQETKHEIINLYFHGEHHGVRGTNLSTGAHGDSAVLGGHDHAVEHDNEDVHVPHLVERGDHGTPSNASHHKEPNITHAPAHHQSDHGQVFSIYECSRSELMGELVDKASPFLFPCTIEYSLLCAGVLYVVWNNINKPEVTRDGDSDISTYLARRVRHHYSVDCAHANRGLFMGILILVLTIISLILFFVLINNEAYKSLAIMEANIIELSVYGVATVTVVVGMIQMRELEFVPDGDIELDNILLLIAQTGVYIYTSFTIIGGHFTMSDARAVMVLPLLSAIITLTQTTLQTIFILDATRRCCYNSEQLERKPGREMVTFLLVCNLAMWAINTFETSRADAHPTQLNFYGIWAWTIISHISMPLAIFYRFHVTVCLCEIWKRSYKLKHEY